MPYEYSWIASPVGRLQLVANGQALAGILWEVERAGRVNFEPMVENNHNPVLMQTAKQLTEYFAGQRESFDVALDFKGTEFQKRVWQALLTIPFGETRTYSEVARQIGAPKAVRAVGAANGRNPISIMAPCHRVVGADGSLTGFAGGLDIKDFLLNLESRQTLSLF